MEGLRARRLVELAYEVGRAEDLDSLRAVVASSMHRLVPGEIAGVTEVEVATGNLVAVTDPPGISEERLADLGRHAHQHPLITRDAGHAEAISDYLPSRRFEALELYQDFYRHVGARDQIAINLPGRAGVAVGVTVNRSRPGFSDHDRAVLDTLRPVLVKGYRRALARERARGLLDDLHESGHDTSVGVVAIAERGRVELTSEAARRLLGSWFPPARDGHLPDAIAKWLAALSSHHTGSLTIRGERAVLLLRVFPHSDPGEPRILEVRERPAAAAAATVATATVATTTLTERELEVLGLVGSGESNQRTAHILGISKRTVDNHLQAIYRKLGVSNRTAAAARLQRETGSTGGYPTASCGSCSTLP